MSRRTRGSDLETRNIVLPKSLWDWIDKLSIDPVRGKPTYGFRTKFFERLIRQEQKRIESLKSLAKEENN